ncbi:zinc-binding alcohol dehydrogenase [Ectothiorhodospiraceae bacterium WFHF3C12]|nr:zinc-binding alcohol dehydrogenase [Ectothiorhodospiraceae bacterium WFHF3C12]
MAKSNAKAFWIVEPGQGELRGERLPEPGTGEVRVRTLYSGVSRGTEALVFTGQVPRGEYQRMRAPHQAGDFPGPVKYGYSSVGVVEHGPAELRDRKVFCLYPHQDRYVVPAADVVPVPESVPAARAVLAANMETAVNGVWDAAPGVGDRVAVVGAGVVGLLAAWLCESLAGTRVQVLDVNPDREAVARDLGLTCLPPQAAQLDNDLVIHASGQPEGLHRALEIAANEATVLEMSWFGSRAVSAPLGEAFHSRRLTLRASQVGQIPPARRPRWSHRRRLELALSLLEDPCLEALISGESPFGELPSVMRALVDSPAGVLCHRLRY